MATGGELFDALGGIAGALPERGVLHVVAVPRFDPAVTSVRAALLVAAADVVRRPVELPPDVLAPLVTGEVVDGTLAACEAGDLDPERVTVQLVATAVQTAPATVRDIARLRAAGVAVEVVASTGEVEAAFVAAGLGPGVAREPGDGRLGIDVVAADRPDVARWRSEFGLRGHLPHSPTVVIEAAGTAAQRATRMQLTDLAGHPAVGPVVAVVGEDVEGPEDWRDRLPLRGIVVSNHRAAHQAPALTARLRSLGAHVVEAPLLAIGPGDEAAMVDAVRSLAAGSYDLLGLTSPNGVRALATAVAVAGLDARALAHVGTIACVGPGTAAMLRSLLTVDADLIAEVSTTEGLAAAIGAPAGGAGRALLTRADLATEVLHERLVADGWDVDEVTAYSTLTQPLEPAVAQALAGGDVELVPVLSSSMAEALVASGRELGVRAGIVSIGPVTSATLRSHGVEPLAEAESHDLDGLVACLAVCGRAVRDT